MTQTRAIFGLEDVKALFQKCDRVRPREETDFDKVANELEFIVLCSVSSFRRRTAPTPGEDQKWLLGIAHLAKGLLAAFGINKPLDQPDNKSVFMLGAPVDVPLQREDLYLRSKMAAEIDAREPPSEWAAIRVTLRGLQVMLARAEWAAATAGLNKGAVRKAPPDEVSLVAALHRLYADVTGDKRWHTINVNNGAPGGPFVDFVMAVAAHIHDHLDNAMDPPAPEAFANNIKTLSTSPRRVAKRIGLARKILKT